MKFNQGHWMLLPDTRAAYPVCVVDSQIEKDSVSITGYHRPVVSRADYLDGVSVTVRFSSPLPGVIRVQIAHFKGRRKALPEFDLDYARTNPAAVIRRGDKSVTLDAGGLAVELPTEGGWRYTFSRGGQTCTESASYGLALMTHNGKTYMREQLSLCPDETVYGLGERFGHFVKNGQSINIWNEDGGTDSDIAYKNIPFYLTSRGYGVLINNPGNVSLEVASHQVNSVQFSVEGHSLDYYIFGGPTLKNALEQYTALSGRPPLLPAWSYSLWLTTSFVTNYDEKAIMANIDRMESSGIPLGVFHFDCFWMKELTWCSFIWDKRNFPDPAGMLKRIKAKGIKICVWINPYIAEASPLFEEGARSGFLLKTPDGDVYQRDQWQPGLAYVDFTNPGAVEWYQSKLAALVDMGVDTFKTDFGERIPVDVVYHDGSDPLRMHNFYTYLYNKAVFELLQKEKGPSEAVVFARSATCGNQKFPVHWGGDNCSSYGSMAETLRGGLSFGLCGFGYWSHDISGFVGTATPDLYKRWVAFGMLSSHSRLHGNDSVRMPWCFGDESVDVVRHFTRLKQQIMPYILDMAQDAHEHGWPIMRAMVLEFPDDPACRYLAMQYMFGTALLVAPVFNDRGENTYYLPSAKWRNLLTGEITDGGSWRTEKNDYFSLGLWVHIERGKKWECLKEFRRA